MVPMCQQSPSPPQWQSPPLFRSAPRTGGPAVRCASMRGVTNYESAHEYAAVKSHCLQLNGESQDRNN